MTSTKDRCARCGGTTGNAKSGSITQWMATCNCNSTIDFPSECQGAPVVCATCNKRIITARKGSFTQWIFRADVCNCLSTAQRPATPEQSVQKQQDSSKVLPTVELDVDPDKFPIVRYGPIAVLGSGASGLVYLCRDRVLGKKVALKLLNSTKLTSNQLIAFQKEAKSTSRLNHRNIVKILDFGVNSDNSPYMVMEFFEGEDLFRVIKEHGPLDVETAIRVFLQVCDGLSEAHKHGVFHRDIKSANILVRNLNAPVPDVWIIDFGLAAIAWQPDHSCTVQGLTIVGTPQYMSPDQLGGQPFNERSEIYSVGCALFEALTGTTPFRGQTALEIFNQHHCKGPPKLRETRSDLEFPQELEEIVSSCLAKDPVSRPASMVELAELLRSALTNVTLENPSTEESTPPRRSKWVSAIVLLALVSIGSTSIFLYQSQQRSDDLKHDKKRSPQKTLVSGDQPPPGFRTDVTGFWSAGKNLTDRDMTVLLGTHVKQLSFSDNYLVTDQCVRDVAARLPLESLDISDTKLGDSAMGAIADMKTLLWLHCTRSAVTDVGLMKLGRMPNLLRVDIDSCPGVTDKGLEHVVKNLPNLQVLNISDTHVTSKGIRCISGLKKLQMLWLSDLKVVDKDLAALQNLEISDIHLFCNPITDASFDSFRKMKRLRFVEVSGCKNITADGVSKLKKDMPNIFVRWTPPASLKKSSDPDYENLPLDLFVSQ